MSPVSSLRTTSRSRFHFEHRSKHSETTTRTFAAASALGSLYADVCPACRWNEWIVLPIRYCDLPLSAQVTFTVWDIAGPRAAMPVGRIDISPVWQEVVRAFQAVRALRSSSPPCPTPSLVFLYCSATAHGRTLRRGKHRLLLWPGVEADGSLETTTPSKLVTQDEMGRLEKVNAVRLCLARCYVQSFG